MDKDKELLLQLGKSDDSDDVVEEFKLPPPRTRRPRTRKAISEARILSARTSFISLKCILTFFLISVVLSGALLLAFYLLTMQASITDLQNQMREMNSRSGETATLSKRINDAKIRISKIEKTYKEKFLKIEEENKALQNQMKIINQTIKDLKKSTSVQLSHRVKFIEKDLDTIKNEMAHTGATLNKVQDAVELNKVWQGSVETKIKTLRLYVYNYTTQVRRVVGDVMPINVEGHNSKAQKIHVTAPPVIEGVDQHEPGVTKDYVNSLISEIKEELNKDIRKNSGVLLLELTNLKTITDSLNRTHSKGLDSLTNEVHILKNKSESLSDEFLQVKSQLPHLMILFNTTSSINEVLEKHGQKLKKHHDLIKALKTGLLQSKPTKVSSTKVTRKNSESTQPSQSSEELVATTKPRETTTKPRETTTKPRETTTKSPESLEPKELPKSGEHGSAKPKDQLKSTKLPATKPAVTKSESSSTYSVTASVNATSSSSTDDNDKSTPTVKAMSSSAAKEVVLNATSSPDIRKSKTSDDIIGKIKNLLMPGPVLPDEGGISKDALNEFPTPPPSDHNVPRESLQSPVFEQKAKKEESEQDYPAFETVHDRDNIDMPGSEEDTGDDMENGDDKSEYPDYNEKDQEDESDEGGESNLRNRLRGVLEKQLHKQQRRGRQ